jgi:hypothetical protein
MQLNKKQEKNMSKLKMYAKITAFFLVLSLLAMLFSFLALNDIAHGGEDLRSEWTALRITAFILLALFISTFITLRQAFKLDN